MFVHAVYKKRTFLYANRYAKTGWIGKDCYVKGGEPFPLRDTLAQNCAISNSQVLRHQIVSLLNETILIHQFYQPRDTFKKKYAMNAIDYFQIF